MKTFQKYIENIESPNAGVAQTTNPSNQTPQLTQMQNQPMQEPAGLPDRKQIQQALFMLSKKLGTKFNSYKPLINDIQPKNMSLFFNLIQDLSTLKQSSGTNVFNQINKQ
jgi:hypothetical protein